jgi:hypothetical protein
MGIEEFKALVVKRARAKPAPAPQPVAEPGSPLNGFVFLNHAAEDIETAKPVLKALGDSRIACMLPLEEGDPSEIREDLEENLRECEALIIVYGAAPVGWVRQQVRQFRRARRTRPPLAHGIYEGPPSAKSPLGFELPGLKIIDCRDGFLEERLQQFFTPS